MSDHSLTLIEESELEYLIAENARLKELNQKIKFALQEAVEIEPSLLACGMIVEVLAKAEEES